MSINYNQQTDSIITTSGTLDFSSNTGALVLPTGSTSQRPTGKTGAIRFNNSGTSSVEVYNGTIWTSLNAGVNGPTNNISTNNAIAVWNGSNGNSISNSNILLDSIGNITMVNSISGALLNFGSGNFSAQLLAPTRSVGDSTSNVATTQFVAQTLSNQTRTTLTSDLQIFVSTTGNDSNSGSGSSPFLTISRAIQYVQLFDLNGHNITINVSAGTFSACSFSGNLIGNYFSGIYLSGAGSNTVINGSNQSALILDKNSIVTIENMTIQTSTSGHGCLVLDDSYLIIGNNITFGTCAQSHMIVSSGGRITIPGNSTYTISGGAQTHITAIQNGQIFNSGNTINIQNNPNFSYAFAQANASYLEIGNCTFNGVATGTKYIVSENGVIYTGGQGESYLPGTINGIKSSGGIYNQSPGYTVSSAAPSGGSDGDVWYQV